MPMMNGYELATRLRKLPSTRAVLTAVSGWGQESDRLRAIEAGFNHHLVKPVLHHGQKLALVMGVLLVYMMGEKRGMYLLIMEISTALRILQEVQTVGSLQL